MISSSLIKNDFNIDIKIGVQSFLLGIDSPIRTEPLTYIEMDKEPGSNPMKSVQLPFFCWNQMSVLLWQLLSNQE